MPGIFGSTISESDLDDLIAYLATLDGRVVPETPTATVVIATPAEPQVKLATPTLATPEPSDGRMLWGLLAVALITLGALVIPASLAIYNRRRDSRAR